MTDLEGISKKLMKNGWSKDSIIQILINEYKVFKTLPDALLLKMANAVYHECKKSNIDDNLSKVSEFLHQLLNVNNSGITMGEGGVGCRGKGDFFVHSLLAKLSETSMVPLISPISLDDTGAIELDNDPNVKSKIILTKMEGMHSRLSDFPFLAGFHVTRAALRDIYVKGGIPLSIMVDVHLADDGDIGKLFDFQAGIATVAELSSVPITAGSTLRIGGDMVIGERITGGIAAVGEMKYSFFRKNIQEGDVIIMTEGAGGGTISTTGLYSGHYDTILETMNLNFLEACEALFKNPAICAKIHAMADVTNGGLRGDLYEINKESKLGAKIDLNCVMSLVNSNVMNLLKEAKVDYLGVSLDALLVFSLPENANNIINLFKKVGIKSSIIGQVLKDDNIVFISEDGEETIAPKYRESSYTKIKEVVDNIPDDLDQNFTKIENAFKKSIEKKEKIIKYIQKTKSNL